MTVQITELPPGGEPSGSPSREWRRSLGVGSVLAYGIVKLVEEELSAPSYDLDRIALLVDELLDSDKEY